MLDLRRSAPTSVLAFSRMITFSSMITNMRVPVAQLATAHAANGISKVPTSTLDMRKRHDAKLFFGRLKTDDENLMKHIGNNMLLDLEKLRKRAANAAMSGEFVDIAFDTVRWMEKLPTKSTLHFPTELAFINRPSPAYPLLVHALTSIFEKVSDELVETGKQQGSIKPHNGGGVAIDGPRGVGKCNVLRLLAIVPALLFPEDVLSIYVDYSTYNKNSFSISHLLAAALENLHPELKEPLANVQHIEEVLDLIAFVNRKVVVAVDELAEVYGHALIWQELECLATGYSTCLFVADSGSKLKATRPVIGT
jgi:hypothetical protein